MSEGPGWQAACLPTARRSRGKRPASWGVRPLGPRAGRGVLIGGAGPVVGHQGPRAPCARTSHSGSVPLARLGPNVPHTPTSCTAARVPCQALGTQRHPPRQAHCSQRTRAEWKLEVTSCLCLGQRIASLPDTCRPPRFCLPPVCLIRIQFLYKPP